MSTFLIYGQPRGERRMRLVHQGLRFEQLQPTLESMADGYSIAAVVATQDRPLAEFCPREVARQ